MVDCWMRKQIAPFTVEEEFLWGKKGKAAIADEHDAWHDLTGIYHRWSTEILMAYPGSAFLMAIRDAATLSSRLVLNTDDRDLVSHRGEGESVRLRINVHHHEELADFLKARQQAGTLESGFPAMFYVLTTISSYAGIVIALVVAAIRRDRLLLGLCLAVVIALFWSTFVQGGLSAPIARYTVKSSWLAMFATLVGMTRIFSAPLFTGH